MFAIENEWLAVLVIGALLLAFLIWGPEYPRSTPIDWMELRRIMPTAGDIQYLKEIGEGEGRSGLQDAHIKVRFMSEKSGTMDSVMYYSTRRDDGKRAETLDVSRRGEFGFIVTFVDEQPTTFERIGGRTTANPEFAPSQLNGLVLFLRRFRGYAEQHVLYSSRHA